MKTITAARIEEIGHGIGDAHAIDTSPENDLLFGDDEALNEAGSETFEIGEMIPEIDSEGAARTLLTPTRDTEVIIRETGPLEAQAPRQMMSVYRTKIKEVYKLTLAIRQLNLLPLSRRPTTKGKQSGLLSWNHGRRKWQKTRCARRKSLL